MAAKNPWSGVSPGGAGSMPWGPAPDVCLVTLADSDNIFEPDGVTATTCKAFAVETPGAVKVTTAAGRAITLPAWMFASGRAVAIECTRIWLTGTGAVGQVVAFLGP